MGVDSNGAPYTLFRDIKVSGIGKTTQSIKKGKHPFKLALPEVQPEHFDIHLTFAQHYEEPDLRFRVSMAELTEHEGIEYLMVFDAAKTGNWELVLMHNKNKDMIGLAEFHQIAPT